MKMEENGASEAKGNARTGDGGSESLDKSVHAVGDREGEKGKGKAKTEKNKKVGGS